MPSGSTAEDVEVTEDAKMCYICFPGTRGDDGTRPPSAPPSPPLGLSTTMCYALLAIGLAAARLALRLLQQTLAHTLLSFAAKRWRQQPLPWLRRGPSSTLRSPSVMWLILAMCIGTARAAHITRVRYPPWVPLPPPLPPMAPQSAAGHRRTA